MEPLLKRQLASLGALVLTAVIGCGSPPVPLVEVSGVLKVNGKPAPEMAIDFMPDPEKGNFGPPSSALTDQEGKFILVCSDGRSGAAVGLHRVVVRDNRSIAGAPNTKFGGTVKPLHPSRIPNSYAAASSTPLKQEVKAEPQTITLEIAGAK
jgi:hypothetical protein